MRPVPALKLRNWHFFRKINIFFSGDILQEAVRQLQPGVKVGKILIQRDESSFDKAPILFYKKLPKDISECFVILVDPMLATSGKKVNTKDTNRKIRTTFVI